MSIGKAGTSAPYSFSSRFESGQGHNPEELIAAAHAGCFSMAFANKLAGAGHKPVRIRTTANVHLEKGEAGFSITKIELDTEGEVENIDGAAFGTIAEEAKAGCPVSKALSAVPISLKAKLLSAKTR